MLLISLIMPSIHAKTTRKDELISYIDECEIESTFASMAGAATPSVESTYHALYILNRFNKLDRITSEDAIEFVNSCKNEDFGFGNTPESDSDIFSTYYAIWIFDLFEVEMYNETFDWVVELQNGTEGFSHEINGNVSLMATYYGLEALYMNNTDLMDYNMSTWLLERQNTNPASQNYGGFATDGNSSNIWGTWAAMGAIARLNISMVYLVNPLVVWINASQNLNPFEDDYGNFASEPGENDYSLLHMYAAVSSLWNIDESYLSQIDEDAALNLLLDLQNEDGGFRVNSIDAASSLSACFYAICTLDLLGGSGRLNDGAPWVYGFGLPLWAWILIGVGIVIVAILLIRKYYLY
jgi:geranylgeranyl transferase type-2 subunit beta